MFCALYANNTIDLHMHVTSMHDKASPSEASGFWITTMLLGDASLYYWVNGRGGGGGGRGTIGPLPTAHCVGYLPQQ